MFLFRHHLKALWLIGLALGLSGCLAEGSDVSFPGQDIRMTFLHTTDSHSKALPFKFVPNVWDERMGIVPCEGDSQLADCHDCLGWQIEDIGDDTNITPDPLRCTTCIQFAEAEDVCDACHTDQYEKVACYECISEVRSSARCTDYTFGGSSRVAYAINRERSRALRSAYIDTGDFFQGAPVFNLFSGAAEVRALSAMGVDVAVIGNHEFDKGARNLADILYKYAQFPVLNANYLWEDFDTPGSMQLGKRVNPFFVKDYNGLKIGYIGMGNVHSLNSLGDADNSMGIRAMDTIDTVETYVPMLRSQVDLVVLLSHLGLDSDIEVARQVPGIDIIFGGHDHIVVYPPIEVENPDGKTTLVVHSGVNNKCVGRLDVVVRDGEILMHTYKVIPVQTGPDLQGETLGEDPLVANILYDYEFELDRAQNLDRIIGYAKDDMPRVAPGDSPLGNLVADAMRARRRVETDFSMTNSLGIRADLDKGPISLGKVYEIFPFENSVVTMYMAGSDLQRLFDYAASRTAAYGCKTQIQISGARCVMDCSRGLAKYLEINGIVVVDDYKLLQPYIVFSMATNDYIGNGGSGFDILEQNTTKSDTSLSLRDIVVEYVEDAGEVEPFTDGRIELQK